MQDSDAIYSRNTQVPTLCQALSLGVGSALNKLHPISALVKSGVWEEGRAQAMIISLISVVRRHLCAVITF